MVSRLFKQVPEIPYQTLMHAVSALLGETIEWMEATSRKNFIEEAGDIEFYITAIFQHIPAATAVPIPSTARAPTVMTLGTVFANVASLANDIFDITKKSWVYGKALDSQMIHYLLGLLRANMTFAYEMFGTTAEEVQTANKRKLIGPGGRFESGFYSDAQAIARADKLTGEPVDPLAKDIKRSFIGQQDKS